jgi:hypothetical protein
MGMGTFSLWHYLVMALVGLAVAIPFASLLPRAGIPRWVALFAFIPIVPLILLWVLAFKRWPNDP